MRSSALAEPGLAEGSRENVRMITHQNSHMGIDLVSTKKVLSIFSQNMEGYAKHSIQNIAFLSQILFRKFVFTLDVVKP